MKTTQLNKSILTCKCLKPIYGFQKGGNFIRVFFFELKYSKYRNFRWHNKMKSRTFPKTQSTWPVPLRTKYSTHPVISSAGRMDQKG